jgi:hypothetical protein
MLRDPVPAALVTSSAIPGYSHIRYWGDDAAAIDTRMVDEIAEQQRASGNMAAIAISSRSPAAAVMEPLAPVFSSVGQPPARDPNSPWSPASAPAH